MPYLTSIIGDCPMASQGTKKVVGLLLSEREFLMQDGGVCKLVDQSLVSASPPSEVVPSKKLDMSRLQ